MDPRKLLATAFVALLVGGLVWWSGKNKKDDEPKGPGAAPKTVLELKSQDLRKIELVRRDAETTVLESSDGKTWRLTSPLATATDAETTSALVGSLATVSADEIVEEKVADFAGYGLAKPYLTATLTMQGGKSHTVQFGDEAPVGSGTYARIDNTSRLVLLNPSTRTAIDKFGADLRDRRILTVNFDQLKHVVLKSKQGEVEFAKSGADWSITKPAPMRADGWAVEEVLRKLREAKFDATLTFDDLKGIAAAFPAAEPVITATFSDGANTQTVELRRNAAAKKVYVRTPAIDAPQLLAGEPLEGLDKSAADFRSKKLFDFGFSEPSSVGFKDAAKEFTVHKSGDKWSSGGKAMDSVGVQSLIDRLRDLSATGFPSVPMPETKIELTVVSNEGKRQEKVLFGMAGDKWYARRENEPAIYEVAAEAVSQLVKTAGDVREAPAPPKSPPTPKK